jgi:ATP:ADP antiporter, AAA family
VNSSRAEGHAVRLAMLTAALAIAHQVAGKSLREGLFLSIFKVQDLPKMMLGSALCAIPIVLLVSRLMTRHGPDRLTPLLFVVSAVLSVGEYLLLPIAAHAIALTVYLHVSIGGALMVSAFWSLVNERLDPHTMKRSVGRITAGATLGGLVGGAAMERGAHWLDARTLLLLVAGMCLLSAAASQRLAATTATSSSGPASRVQEPVKFTGYLWTLALLVSSTAAASAFADFALKQAAQARFGSAESLVRFFAVFYTAGSLLSFVLQAFASRPLFDSLGLGGTLAVSPALGVGLGAFASLSPSFWSMGALRGADLALGPSLFRSAFEPLFTPLPSATKRATKSLIDVVFDKGGDAAASLAILLVSLGSPLFIERVPLLLSTFAFALAFLLSLRARQGYVAELESSLRAGTVSVEAVEVEDPAARLTLSATTLGIDREKLRAEIERARAERAARAESGAAVAPPSAAEQERLVTEVRTLLGQDVAALRSLLTGPALDHRLAAFVVPHLASDQLAKPALGALRAMGPDVVGLLADVMLSGAQPPAVRRRIPHVLRALRGPRVVSALTRALGAEALEVRYRAALALAEVTHEDRALLPESKEVFALALAEVERGPLSQDASDHVFALLSLCLTRGSMELVRQGLRTDDRKLRGTALEYLESLLPEAVRSPLVEALAERAEPRSDVSRTETQLLDELKRSIRADFTPQALAGDPD